MEDITLRQTLTNIIDRHNNGLISNCDIETILKMDLGLVVNGGIYGIKDSLID